MCDDFDIDVLCHDHFFLSEPLTFLMQDRDFLTGTKKVHTQSGSFFLCKCSLFVSFCLIFIEKLRFMDNYQNKTEL